MKTKLYKNIAFYFSTLLMITTGLDEMEKGKVFIGLMILIVGVVVLAVTLLKDRLGYKILYFDAGFYLANALLLLLIGYGFVLEGKKYLPYAYILASLIYFGLSVFYWMKPLKKQSEI